MRTPQQVRLTALIAYGLALLAGVIAAYLMHLLFGSAGELGFNRLNPGGILEFLAFGLAFSSSLLGLRELMNLPFSTLLTAGLIGPSQAAKVAQPITSLENPTTLEFGAETVVLKQNGRPVGLHDSYRDRTLAWEDVPRVSGGVAVTELRALLSQRPFVVVTDGDDVRGLITQEMFLAGLWRRRH